MPAGDVHLHSCFLSKLRFGIIKVLDSGPWKPTFTLGPKRFGRLSWLMLIKTTNWWYYYYGVCAGLAEWGNNFTRGRPKFLPTIPQRLKPRITLQSSSSNLRDIIGYFFIACWWLMKSDTLPVGLSLVGPDVPLVSPFPSIFYSSWRQFGLGSLWFAVEASEMVTVCRYELYSILVADFNFLWPSDARRIDLRKPT